jgi:hypothetical protein
MTNQNAGVPTCHFCGVAAPSPAYNPNIPEVCKYHWLKLCAVAPPYVVKSYRRYLRQADPHNYSHKTRFDEAVDGIKLYMQRLEKGIDTL